MAQIRFTEMQELFCECMGEAQGLCSEKRVIDILGVDEAFLDDSVEIISGLSDSLDGGMTLAFAYSEKVLYARIYDGKKYVFPLPFMLSEDADAVTALTKLAAYTLKEMIPLIITDVPRDEIEFLCSIFPHVDAYTYEDDDDSFFIKVNNECDMLDEVPKTELDGITLDEIGDSDKEVYAELCRNRELNRYWGYDVYADNPDGDADFYLNTVRREFNDGIALTLAIRESGEFVGEATVYGFDYRGGASIAVRVLPRCHGRGIGSRATKSLIMLASNIGLKTLYAEILSENENSIKMTSKYMTLVKSEKCKKYFTLSL